MDDTDPADLLPARSCRLTLKETTCFGVTLDALKRQFNTPSKEAAAELGLSQTMMQKICRKSLNSALEVMEKSIRSKTYSPDRLNQIRKEMDETREAIAKIMHIRMPEDEQLAQSDQSPKLRRRRKTLNAIRRLVVETYSEEESEEISYGEEEEASPRARSRLAPKQYVPSIATRVQRIPRVRTLNDIDAAYLPTHDDSSREDAVDTLPSSSSHSEDSPRFVQASPVNNNGLGGLHSQAGICNAPVDTSWQIPHYSFPMYTLPPYVPYYPPMPYMFQQQPLPYGSYPPFYPVLTPPLTTTPPVVPQHEYKQ